MESSFLFRCLSSKFFFGTKSSHSDLPKGTNKYLLKELLGVAGVEQFLVKLTTCLTSISMEKSSGNPSFTMAFLMVSSTTFGVFFQEEPCRVVLMKKPLISWAPEAGWKLVDLPSLKVTPKAPEKWMVGKRSGFLFWLVVSKIFYVHPYLGKIPILTNIFQMGCNHQLVLG